MHHLRVTINEDIHDLYFSFNAPKDCGALVKERFGEEAEWELYAINFEDEWWKNGSD